MIFFFVSGYGDVVLESQSVLFSSDMVTRNLAEDAMVQRQWDSESHLEHYRYAVLDCHRHDHIQQSQINSAT